MSVSEALPAVPSTRPHRFSWTVVLLTSIAVALYFPLQYSGGSLKSLPSNTGLAATYANRPLAVQVAFYAHIIFAGLALLIGPFQFSAGLRHRHVRIHHAVGRIYITACLIGGTAAFVMSFFSSVAFSGFFGFGSLAVIWILVTVTAYRAIRRGDIASHRAWMMRSFALTYAAPTLRLWLFALLIPQLIAGVPFAQAYHTAYAPVPFLAWIPNLVIVELMIRRRGLPALHLSPSPSTSVPPPPLQSLPHRLSAQAPLREHRHPGRAERHLSQAARVGDQRRPRRHLHRRLRRCLVWRAGYRHAQRCT